MSECTDLFPELADPVHDWRVTVTITIPDAPAGETGVLGVIAARLAAAGTTVAAMACNVSVTLRVPARSEMEALISAAMTLEGAVDGLGRVTAMAVARRYAPEAAAVDHCIPSIPGPAQTT